MQAATAVANKRQNERTTAMPDQTDAASGNHGVATVDDLTNEQFVKLIVQAQKAFGRRSRKTFDEQAGVRFAVAAVDGHNRQPEEVE
jgi:hypothetical protein